MSHRKEIQALLAHPLIVGPSGVPSGATESDIQALESLRGLRLPPSVRDWYPVVNGAFCGAQVFLGPDGHRAEFQSFFAKQWLPVAEDGCGDYYLIDLSGPDQGEYPVFFWDHESDQDDASGDPI